jgi:hypothetical protein
MAHIFVNSTYNQQVRFTSWVLWVSAAVMKQAVNAQYGVQVAIWAEMLAILDRLKIVPETAMEILNTLPTTSIWVRGSRLNRLIMLDENRSLHLVVH